MRPEAGPGTGAAAPLREWQLVMADGRRVDSRSTDERFGGPLERAWRPLKLEVCARASVRPRRCGPIVCGGSHRFYHGRRDRTRPPVLSESTRRRVRHLFVPSPCAFSPSLLAITATLSATFAFHFFATNTFGMFFTILMERFADQIR